MNRILLFASIMIVLAACGPASLPATEAPTSQPLNTSIPAAAVVVPALPLETQPELTVSHLDPIRVIPSTFDPSANFDQVLSAYKDVMNGSSQSTTWFSGTTSGNFDFQLDINLAPSAVGETITLQYPIHVTIARTEASGDSLNLIIPASGGGGGLTNTFPSFNLQPGVIDISPTETYGTELAPGGASGIFYDIRSACLQSGVYNVTYQIPYRVTTSGVTQFRMIPYNMVLACPQEETIWVFDPNTDKIYTTWNYILKNGTYVSK